MIRRGRHPDDPSAPSLRELSNAVRLRELLGQTTNSLRHFLTKMPPPSMREGNCEIPDKLQFIK